MIADRQLTAKKSIEKPPEGRESWKDAENQVRGNIEWALEFMEVEEIIELLAEASKSDLVQESTISEAVMLKKYHQYSASKIDNRLPENEAGD